jgi:hypothetical protein
MAAKALVMFWLIASEDKTKQGLLPSIKELSFRLRTTEKTIESIVSKLSHWMESDGAEPISSEHHPDTPETEESREEVEKKPAETFTLPEAIRTEVWKAFVEHRKKLRKPMTNHARDLILKECEKLGGDPNDLLDQSIRKGWQDVFPMKEQPPSQPTAEASGKPPHLCVAGGCGKIGIIGNGRRMYCREHNPDNMRANP